MLRNPGGGGRAKKKPASPSESVFRVMTQNLKIQDPTPTLADRAQYSISVMIDRFVTSFCTPLMSFKPKFPRTTVPSVFPVPPSASKKITRTNPLSRPSFLTLTGLKEV